MKHKLIMENWRRFQNEQDDRLIVEGKKRDFDSLMEDVVRGNLQPLVVATALDEHVSKKLRQFDQLLVEGFFKDSIKKLALSLTNYVISGIANVSELLSQALGNLKNRSKLFQKCIAILDKLKPYAEKAGKIIGPVAKVAIVTAIVMIFQNEALASTVTDGSISIDALQAAADLLMDLSTSGDGFDVTTVTDQVTSSVSGAEGTFSTAERSVAGVETVMADADRTAIDAFEGIKMLIDKAELSGENKISQEQAKKIIDAFGDQAAMLIQDQIKAAEELCKTDPEACEIAKEQYQSLSEMVKTYTNSTVSKINTMDDTTARVTQQTTATVKSLKR
jgi:vacuolar-type H+-ATPase subunit H